MSTQLLLGTAKTDITPLQPVPLAGFAVRSGMGGFEKVSAKLYARIFAFAQQGEDGKQVRSLLISADILWWAAERVDGIKREIDERFGIEPSFVLLHATHTHSGPQTSESYSSSLGLPDIEYIKQMEQWVLDGIEQALSGMEPVTVERGVGECRINVHRRRLIDGEIVLAPNEEVPIDHEVIVFRFRNQSGRMVALLTHYTCHPTISTENSVSSEFCGAAMEMLENRIGNGLVSGYLQGFCGDINPRVIKDGQFSRGGALEIAALGQTFAESIFQVLDGEMEPLATGRLSANVAAVDVPVQRVPSLEELESLIGDDGLLGEWSNHLLRNQKLLRPTLPMKITKLRLADKLTLVAVNAEMVLRYGTLVKELSNHEALPVGYTNGMIGYVPTEEQIAEGGYEAFGSAFYFGLPSPLDPSVEKLVADGISELVKSAEPNSV